MIVCLLQAHDDAPDLEPGAHYTVIGIEADHYRILADRGQPYLYPPELFDVVDSAEPGDWLRTTGEDGERYAYPPSLDGVGFFEDFFEGEPQAVTTFWREVNRYLGDAA